MSSRPTTSRPSRALLIATSLTAVLLFSLAAVNAHAQAPLPPLTPTAIHLHMSLRLTPTVPADSQVIVEGDVVPAAEDAQINIDRQVNGKWRHLTSVVASGSHFRFRMHTGHSGAIVTLRAHTVTAGSIEAWPQEGASTPVSALTTPVGHHRSAPGNGSGGSGAGTAKKVKSRQPALRSVACVIGKEVTSLASTNLERINFLQPKNIEGHMQAADQVLRPQAEAFATVALTPTVVMNSAGIQETDRRSSSRLLRPVQREDRRPRDHNRHPRPDSGMPNRWRHYAMRCR